MRARAAIRARDLLLRVLWFSHSCASNHIPITAFGFGRAGDFSTIVRFRGRQKVAGIGPFLTPVILAAKRLEPNEQLLPYSGRAAMVRTISVRGGAFNLLILFGLAMLSHSQSLTSSPISKWLVARCLLFFSTALRRKTAVRICVSGHVRKRGLVQPVGYSRFDVLFAMNVRIRVMLCKVLHCHCYTGVHKLLCMWEAHHRLARYMRALETPGHCHIRLTVYIICIAFGTPDRPTCTEKEPRPCCQHRD